MRIAIDTNRYSDIARGLPEAVNVVRTAERIFVPFAVIAELRYGFLAGAKAMENEAKLVRFLASSRIETLYPDEQTTHHYARLRLQLRRQGTPIPLNDLWIAALAVQHNLTLFTRDGHFAHVPQVQCL